MSLNFGNYFKMEDLSRTKRMEFKTVQEYFDSQPGKIKEALKQLKECILKVVPTATEMCN
jgi:tagatose-1,6-bisphosphate aldolase